MLCITTLTQVQDASKKMEFRYLITVPARDKV